jgi:hypothetical protein
MLLEAVSHLANWQKAVRSAEVDADRFLRSARIRARDVTKEVGGALRSERLATVAQRISELSDVDEVSNVASLLLSVPLPLPIFAEIPRAARVRGAPVPGKKAPEVVVAFTSFLLDGSVFKEPHTIEPRVVHDLTVEATISQWPAQAQD